jgi:hypothetical protein
MRLVTLIGSALLLGCAGGRESGPMSNTSWVSKSAIATSSMLPAASSAPLTGQSALLGVQISMRGANPVFRVNFECSDKPIAPRFISVDDPGYHGFAPTFHCLLRADPASASPPNNAQGWAWEYGTTVAGYRLQGACAPLERGRKYDVGADGPGAGNTIFVINEDGTVQVFEGTCPRADRKETTLQ